MQSLMRAVCIAYMVFLTMLLLCKDPTAVIGMQNHLPWILQVLMPYDHELSFTVLAVLAMSVRWPLPRWAIVPIMAAYGGLTEILQGYTGRHPSWRDWFRDLTSIAIGTTICWIAACVVVGFARLRQKRSGAAQAAPCREWEVLQEALSRRAVEPTIVVELRSFTVSTGLLNHNILRSSPNRPDNPWQPKDSVDTVKKDQFHGFSKDP